MADQLRAEKKFVNDKFTVLCTIVDPDVVPAACFVYENSGTTDLGDYIGVIDLDEARRFDIWEGSAIPKFGNKFVRHTEMKKEVDSEEVADQVIAYTLQSVQRLKLEIENAPDDVTVYVI